MATKAKFRWDELKASNPLFSMARTTIETAFYGNNVESVDSKEVYGVASSNRTVSVRKILQLACFLGLSLSDLLSPPPEDNTLAEIREMYQQGISMYHIAQLYGTDRKTIARWVKP